MKKFNWNNPSDDLDIFSTDLKTQEESIILALEIHTFPLEGCCGLIRYDILYPIGYSTDFNSFKRDAIRIIEKYQEDKDIYLFEYFQGLNSQESRGSGKSLYKIELTDGEWKYYESGEERRLRDLY